MLICTDFDILVQFKREMDVAATLAPKDLLPQNPKKTVHRVEKFWVSYYLETAFSKFQGPISPPPLRLKINSESKFIFVHIKIKVTIVGIFEFGICYRSLLSSTTQCIFKITPADNYISHFQQDSDLSKYKKFHKF